MYSLPGVVVCLVDWRMAAPYRGCRGLHVLRVPCWAPGVGLVVGQIGRRLRQGVTGDRFTLFDVDYYVRCFTASGLLGRRSFCWRCILVSQAL